MEPAVLTVDDIYNEVADLARDQGVSTQEIWNDLVDEVIDGHSDLGEIDDEEDTDGMKRDVRAMWGEYKLENGTDDSIVEDVEDFDRPAKADKDSEEEF